MNKKQIYFSILGMFILSDVQAGIFDNLSNANQQTLKNAVDAVVSQVKAVEEFSAPPGGVSPFETELAAVEKNVKEKTSGFNQTMAISNLSTKLTEGGKTLQDAANNLGKIKVGINASKLILPAAKTELSKLLEKPEADATSAQSRMKTFEQRLKNMGAEMRPEPSKPDKGKHPNGFSSDETLDSAKRKLNNMKKTLEKMQGSSETVASVEDLKKRVFASPIDQKSNAPGSNFVMEHKSLAKQVLDNLRGSRYLSKSGELSKNIELSQHITPSDKKNLLGQLKAMESELVKAPEIVKKMEASKKILKEIAVKLGIREPEAKEDEPFINGLIIPSQIPQAGETVSQAFKTTIEGIFKAAQTIMEKEKKADFKLLSQLYPSENYDPASMGVSFKGEYDGRNKNLSELTSVMGKVRAEASKLSGNTEVETAAKEWANALNAYTYNYAQLLSQDLSGKDVEALKSKTPGVQFGAVPALQDLKEYQVKSEAPPPPGKIEGIGPVKSAAKITPEQTKKLQALKTSLDTLLPDSTLNKFNSDFAAADTNKAIPAFAADNAKVVERIKEAQAAYAGLAGVLQSKTIDKLKNADAKKALSDLKAFHDGKFKEAEAIVGRNAINTKGKNPKQPQGFEVLESKIGVASANR